MSGAITIHGIAILRPHPSDDKEEEEEELEFRDLSALYRLFKSLYSHIYRAYRGKKGETEIGYRKTWNSTTVTLFFYVPEIQLRYTGPTFYVPIRRTMMNMMDIYNEKINDMWEPAPGIEPGSPTCKTRRVTARPPRLLISRKKKMFMPKLNTN